MNYFQSLVEPSIFGDHGYEDGQMAPGLLGNRWAVRHNTVLARDGQRAGFWRAGSGLENRDSRVPGRVRNRPLGSGIPGKPRVSKAKFVFQEKVVK